MRPRLPTLEADASFENWFRLTIAVGAVVLAAVGFGVPVLGHIVLAPT